MPLMLVDDVLKAYREANPSNVPGHLDDICATAVQSEGLLELMRLSMDEDLPDSERALCREEINNLAAYCNQPVRLYTFSALDSAVEAFQKQED